MGNESAFGCNFKSAAKAIRTLDDTRLIHYEGDFEAEVTDVYSTMYTRLKGLKEIAEYEVKGNKPHVMCEYGHAMGNGPGGLKAYQDSINTKVSVRREITIISTVFVIDFSIFLRIDSMIIPFPEKSTLQAFILAIHILICF